jgi:phosphoheptose isomerase
MSSVTAHALRWCGVDGQARTDLLEEAFQAMIEAVHEAGTSLRPVIVEAAGVIAGCFAAGGKLLACGNGGSAATVQHFAGEMVGRFRDTGRPGLRALALSADSAVLTGWSSDTGYEDVFARQVATFGQAGDVLLCVSTSGRSPNLIRACQAAGRAGLRTVALLGPARGGLAQAADIVIAAPTQDAQRTQEFHLFILHVISEIVEKSMPGG